MSQKTVDLLEGIAARHSVRAYKPEEVPEPVLRSVMEAARRAPSAKNAQPWEAYVVFGSAMARMRRAMLDAFNAGHRASMAAGSEPRAYTKRAHELFQKMLPCIEKSDWGVHSTVERSIALFDAPAGVFLCLSRKASPFRMLDLGIYVQTLCLCAQAHGLGSCIIGYVKLVEPAVREFLNLPEDQQFLLAIALGYADETSPVNQFQSDRASLEENVRFIAL